VAGDLDRRRLLQAGGLMSLAAVVSACTGGTPQAGSRPASTSAAPAPSSSAPAAPPPPPPPTASPVDLLPQSATCRLTHATIAGPTWFDAQAVRSDIRDDRPGTPLDLAFRVVALPGCAPVPSAVVDLWQCDAGGVYSGFAGVAPGDGGKVDARDRWGDTEASPTDADRWLRGTQLTGAGGVVQFGTIYPGWYPTRTVHLHLKVHLDEKTVLTTQLFFDDAVSDQVHGAAPYSAHPGRDTRNARDAFYSPTALMTLAPDGARWLGAITLGVP
jgi:protocatechuate 3,4-dioxygenase beta subunit